MDSKENERTTKMIENMWKFFIKKYKIGKEKNKETFNMDEKKIKDNQTQQWINLMLEICEIASIHISNNASEPFKEIKNHFIDRIRAYSNDDTTKLDIYNINGIFKINSVDRKTIKSYTNILFDNYNLESIDTFDKAYLYCWKLILYVFNYWDTHDNKNTLSDVRKYNDFVTNKKYMNNDGLIYKNKDPVNNQHVQTSCNMYMKVIKNKFIDTHDEKIYEIIKYLKALLDEYKIKY